MATETQIVREAPEIEARKLALIDSARALIGTNPQLPNYQVAGFSDAQQRALAMGEQGIGAYMPYLTGAAGMVGGATQQFNQGDINRFMNPYQQSVIDESLRQINRQGDISQQNLQAQAVRSGAFGGSREGVQRAELQRGLSDTRNQAITGALSQGYTQALAASEAEKNRLLQGSQAAAGIAQLAQSLGQGDVNFLYNMGQAQQGQNQAELDALRASRLQTVMQPYQNLAYLSDIYKGTPSTQMAASTSYTPSPSPFQTYLGLTGGLITGGAAAKKAGVI
jgi:hypothetical protein